MTYSDEDVRRHVELGEDSKWEFKDVKFEGGQPVGPERNRWCSEIVGFANANGGVILCGVTDDRRFPGMSGQEMDALETQLYEICSDTVKPPVPVQIYRMAPEGEAVLLVEVPQSDVVHECPGGHFIRRGSSTRKMTSDQVQRLMQRRGQARSFSFDKRPVQGTGFGSLAEDLWKPLPSDEGAKEPETALEKLALLTLDENGIMRATVAGVLLCSKHPEEWLPSAYITATHYRGTDRTSDQADEQTITGPLSQQVGAAVKFVIRNMFVATRETPARADLPQYSKRAVFEALVNAVAHRDYSLRGRQIRLSMFADRLEIQSPGSLPNGLTIDNLDSLVATRNEALVDMFKRMPVSDIPGSESCVHLMEKRGDGVPIIKKETKQLCGRLPIYKLIGDDELLLVLPAAPQKGYGPHPHTAVPVAT